jgi:hypothetical protein
LGAVQAELCRYDEAKASYQKAISAYDKVLEQAPEDIIARDNRDKAVQSLHDVQAAMKQKDRGGQNTG